MGANVEKLESSCVTDENEKMAECQENNLVAAQKATHGITI